uniref:Auxin-responsive protein n=1 Tax=Oryza glumipatula TaxID=40148 RepID=A0A0D9YZU2_9ORYZ
MELELGLAPPNSGHLVVDELSSSSGGGSGRAPVSASSAGKRGFREAFQETLLLFDDGSCCNTSDDDCRRRKKTVVGWPPVSSARRACGGANYVKVKKEGDAIGRKVDLALHSSYDELAATLARMFPTNDHQGEKKMANDDHGDAAGPVVTYEDGDGDWMLVGDVPWDDFARSVKRLKILG